MRNIKLGLVAAALLAGAVCGSVQAQPYIGGTPIYMEDDGFCGCPDANWAVVVSSYVFDYASDLPDGFSLEQGELLFIYLMDADADYALSADTFTIGNPYEMPITSVGYDPDLEIDGLDPVDFQKPYLYGYSGPAQATVFTYAGDFSDPYSTLDPTEWSLVWYVAEAPAWALGPATISGGGVGDTLEVPVPTIPGPGTAALMALSALVRRRRR